MAQKWIWISGKLNVGDCDRYHNFQDQEPALWLLNGGVLIEMAPKTKRLTQPKKICHDFDA